NTDPCGAETPGTEGMLFNVSSVPPTETVRSRNNRLSMPVALAVASCPGRPFRLFARHHKLANNRCKPQEAYRSLVRAYRELSSKPWRLQQRRLGVVHHIRSAANLLPSGKV